MPPGARGGGRRGAPAPGGRGAKKRFTVAPREGERESNQQQIRGARLPSPYGCNQPYTDRPVERVRRNSRITSWRGSHERRLADVGLERF
jgi:hypothetical protein